MNIDLSTLPKGKWLYICGSETGLSYQVVEPSTNTKTIAFDGTIDEVEIKS